MRRLGNHAERTLRITRREQERDRAAVAVAKQNRFLQAEGIENLRQRMRRLALHEIGLARAGQRIRAAMAPAFIDQRVATGGARQGVGKMLPLGNAAQALMQKNDGRAKARALAVGNDAHQMAVGAHFQHRRIIGFQVLMPGNQAGTQRLAASDLRRNKRLNIFGSSLLCLADRMARR